ncbi:hypothetical protein ACOSQ4_004680 [Xanthoceras sorbifolium]
MPKQKEGWLKSGGDLRLPSARTLPHAGHSSFFMAERLVFFAQHPPKKMVEDPGGGPNPETHCKCARSSCEEPTKIPPRERINSFKSKLFGVTSPNS